MDIRIQKSLSTIGFDYIIFSDNEKLFTAISETLGAFTSITFQEKDSPQPILKIKKKWISFKPKYFIKTSNKEKHQFSTISTLKRHYQFIDKQDVYDIYGHKKSKKFSVYKNDNQIAWWDIESVKWEGADSLNLILDKDCNKALIIIFCLIIDDILNHEIMRSTGDLNLQRILRDEVKEFNNNWKPE